MLAVISPAKNIELSVAPQSLKTQAPHFIEQAAQLADEMKLKTPSDLQNLMKISEKLADLNWQRFQDWTIEQEGARAAVETFAGDVYQGLDISSLAFETQKNLDAKLNILSGLYGLLKPSDAILPYRLEMGRKIENEAGKDLYALWRPILVEELNRRVSEVKGEKVLINLASNEYFKAIDTKKLDYPVVEVKFRDFKNGQFKVISFFAKRARGLMARYIIENNLQRVEQLKDFTVDGYRYKNYESNQSLLCFDRKEE
jgi:cytoplasmic iron level regulating protein YaaA (DUF328/UPF0246 family)